MLATIEIRRARPYDCATFARSLIAAAADGLLDFEPDVTVEMVEDAFREGSTDPEYDFFIAESEGRLVGALVGNPEVSRGVRSFGMWINAGARRQGAGSKLVAAALAARSGRTFEIEVWPDNEPAIKLYESFGFKPAVLLGERRRDQRRPSYVPRRRERPGRFLRRSTSLVALDPDVPVPGAHFRGRQAAQIAWSSPAEPSSSARWTRSCRHSFD